MISEPVWVYSFVPWPKEGSAQCMFDLFEGLIARTESEFTERGFAAFRQSLLDNGIDLREIERVPKVDPETIP
jgi:hypothetical protein